MKKALNRILLILLLVSSKSVISQIDTVFWFAAPWVTTGHASNIPVVLRLSSFNNATTVRVRQPASTFDTTFVIPANSLVSESLSHLINQIENTPANTVHNRGLKITSNFPITAIYEVVTVVNNPETYSLKGQNGMGLEFVCPFQTRRNNGGYTPTPKSQILIVATQNATVVWVTPRCNVVGHAANMTYSVGLNAGQSYNVENVTNASSVAGQNLSGSIVVSNKPISVTVSDDSVNGVAGCFDLMGDQIVPVEVVGTEYIVNKGGLSPGENEGAYVVATQNFTQVNINDGTTSSVLLNKGDTYYYAIGQPLTYITSDKAVYVIHTSGFGCEMGEAILPPLNCAGSDQVSFTRTNTQTFILNILCKTTAVNNFLLNGSAALVPASGFTVVPGTAGVWSGFQRSYTTAQIPSGVTNLLTNTHPTDSLFAMGVINGGASSGCLYHYMSSFLRKVYVNAGIDQNLCTETTTVSLTGSVDGGAISGIWTTIGGTGTFGSTTSLNTTYTLSTNDLNQSNIKFVLSSTGNCTPIRDTMQLNIFKSPIVDAGNSLTLCKNNITTISLNGSLQLAAGANWATSGSGSFGNSGALNTTYLPSPSDLTAGGVKISLTSSGSLNSCPNTKDSLQITFTNPPVVTMGSNVSVCANNATVAINGAVTVGSTSGAWSGGTGVFSPTNTAFTNTYTPTPTEISAGSVYLVLASTNNGNCKQVKDSLLVTFTGAPVTSAGLDLSACKNNPITALSGNVSGPTTTGMWSGGTGTFNPGNSSLNSLYTPSASEIAAGSVSLTLTSTFNGNCNQTVDNVVINFTNPATVNAGLNLTACKNNATVMLSGVVAGPTTTGIWSNASGSFTLANTVLTNTYSPSSAELSAGFVDLVLTSTNNTPCNQVVDTVRVIFTGAPLVQTGPDLLICKNNPTVAINASVTVGATTGIWSGGAGTFNASNTALSITYIPTPAEIATGTVNLVLASTSNGNCKQEKDSMLITFTNAPVVMAGSDLVSCINNASTVLSGNVTGPTSTGYWSGGSGSYSPDSTFLNSTYTPSANEITAGFVNLYLNSTNNGNCNLVKDTVVINFTNAPTVNAGLSLSVCKNNAAVVLSGVVAGPTNTGIWSGASGGFFPDNTALTGTYTPSASELSAGSASLILSSTNNGTCNQAGDTLVITFTGAPLVAIGPDLSVCVNNATVALNGTVTVGATTGLWSGGLGTFNPGSNSLNTIYTPTPSEILAGFTKLVLESTNNGNCNQVKDSVLISFTSAPTVDAGFNLSACANNAASVLSGSIGGPTTTGYWSGGTGTYNPDSTVIGSTYIPSASEIASGSVSLILNSSNNGNCRQVKDTVVINFTTAPQVNAGLDVSVCKNNAVTSLFGLISGATTTGVWSGVSGSFSPNNTALTGTYTPSAPELTAGFANLILTSTNNGTCNQEVDTVKITFTAAPLVNVGPNISVCANNATIAVNGTVTAGTTTGIWSGTGSGLFSPSTTSLNTVYQLSPSDIALGTFSIKLTSTNNGNCNSVNDSLIVNITPGPLVDAGLNDTICSSNIFYPINGSVSAGASAGVWSTMGNGTFANSGNLSTIYTVGQADTLAGQVKLVLTSTGGNCAPESDTVLVTLTKSPTVNSGPDNTVCDNQLIPLIGVVSSNTGAWTTLGTGSFTPDDSLTSTFYQPSTIDVLNGSVTLVLTSTYNKGCAPVSDTIKLNFKSSPTANFTAANVCSQQSATFTDNSTIPAGTVTGWHWDFGDLGTATTANANHTYVNPGTYTVAHVAYGSNGCNDTVKKTVEIYFLPQALFYNNTSCVGNTTQFVDSSKTVSGAIVSWAWNFGDGQSSTIQNPQHSFSSTNTFTVSLIATSSVGCKDTISKVVTVIPGPNADFSISPNPVEALEVATFTDLSTGPSPLINWYWAFGDSAAANTQNTTHAYNGQGEYSVLLVVKDINGCLDSARHDISIVLLPDVPTAFSPNGDGQNDFFLVRGGPFKTINVRVYNNWGQLIFETNDQLEGWDGKFKDIDQPLGVYVWVVEVEMLNGKSVKKTGDVTLLR
ncbi:MAG: PKD domain-containing protein [Bacteroidota bacterium]